MSLGRRLGMLLENATERRILANLVGDVICVNHHKLKNDLRDYTEVLGFKHCCPTFSVPQQHLRVWGTRWRGRREQLHQWTAVEQVELENP